MKKKKKCFEGKDDAFGGKKEIKRKTEKNLVESNKSRWSFAKKAHPDDHLQKVGGGKNDDDNATTMTTTTTTTATTTTTTWVRGGVTRVTGVTRGGVTGHEEKKKEKEKEEKEEEEKVGSRIRRRLLAN